MSMHLKPKIHNIIIKILYGVFLSSLIDSSVSFVAVIFGKILKKGFFFLFKNYKIREEKTNKK